MYILQYKNIAIKGWSSLSFQQVVITDHSNKYYNSNEKARNIFFKQGSANVTQRREVSKPCREVAPLGTFHTELIREEAVPVKGSEAKHAETGCACIWAPGCPPSFSCPWSLLIVFCLQTPFSDY